jgi:hypothetical protein
MDFTKSGMQVRRMTPKEYVAMPLAARARVESVRVVAARLGGSDFGHLVVEMRPSLTIDTHGRRVR